MFPKSLAATVLLVSCCSVTSAQTVSLPVAEGPYRVTVTLDGGVDGSEVTIVGEARRALLGKVQIAPGEQVDYAFTVWRLSDKFADGSTLRLHPREVGIATYDDVLSLDVLGSAARVESIDIEPAPQDITTIFLAGDSTVTDQPGVPWSAWGAMLPMYFDENVAVANFAASGRALRSFRAERRFEKILNLLKPGDYVFIQFGHNDQKEQGDGISAFESYTDDLIDYVEKVRAAGGQPVLLTSMVRRRFDGDGKWYDTLGDYPEAVRRVAEKQNVPLIDLFESSKQIVEALGVEPSKRMFMHYAANSFSGQIEAIKDDTHFNTYGGDLLARAVINQMKEAVPELAAHLRDPETGIDVSNPESFDHWHWPEVTDEADAEKPEGS